MVFKASGFSRKTKPKKKHSYILAMAFLPGILRRQFVENRDMKYNNFMETGNAAPINTAAAATFMSACEMTKWFRNMHFNFAYTTRSAANVEEI